MGCRRIKYFVQAFKIMYSDWVRIKLYIIIPNRNSISYDLRIHRDGFRTFLNLGLPISDE